MTLAEWLAVGTPIALGAWAVVKFLQARKIDARTAQSGAASNHREGIDQIIKGYDLLLDQAQETIKDDQVVKKLLEERITRFVGDLEICRTENARYREKYGPLPPVDGTAKPV